MHTLLIVYVLAIVGSAFVIGLGIGWILTRDSDISQRSKLKTGISIVVTIVWLIAVIADIFVSAYTLSPLIHGIMGAIVGYFFTDGDTDISLTDK